MGSESPSGWNTAYSMDDLERMQQNAGIRRKTPKVDNDGGEVGGVELGTKMPADTTKYADTGEAPPIKRKVFTPPEKQTGRENNQSGGSGKRTWDGYRPGRPGKAPTFTKSPINIGGKEGASNQQHGSGRKIQVIKKAPKPTEGGRD